MWKKILPLTFFGSFIAVTCSNVVSCNIIKQKQFSFNLTNWKDSWAFTTQNLYQAMAVNKGGKFLLKDSDGLFLYDENGDSEELGYSLFEKFDSTPEHKSSPDQLETYLQLRYFVPSIIVFNEKKYDSPLKDLKDICRNFTISYETLKGEPSTKILKLEDLPAEQKLSLEQQGDVSELKLKVDQASTILESHFNLTISLKTPHYDENQGEWITEDGYYIKGANKEEAETGITWVWWVYFYLNSF